VRAETNRWAAPFVDTPVAIDPRCSNWTKKPDIRRLILGPLALLATLAGVGFTVALFVNELAFDSEALVERARLGILAGSLAAGLLGLLPIWILSGSPGKTDAQ
jgi:hypothetical protein